jgi:filamentous hemagglutinin
MFRPSQTVRRLKGPRGIAPVSTRSLSLGLLALMSAGLPAQAGDNFRRAAAPAASPAGPAAGAGEVTAAQAQAIRQSARESLRRTTLTLGAVQAMQSAARAAALEAGGLVPNGLTVGGLEVHPGVASNPSLWQGAALPVETSDDADNITVTVRQTTQQAVLNWSSFNVGQETTLTFDQSAGGADKSQWIAFNKVSDPSGVPSRILGSIKADGQVYLVNRNGIIFGGASQINVHALVASSLSINDTLVSRGLLNNPDTQFLFAAPTTDPLFAVGEFASNYTLDAPVLAGTKPAVRYTTGLSYTNLVANTDYTLATDGEGKTVVNFTAGGLAKVGAGLVSVAYTPAKIGDVVVRAGARLSSPTSADKVGGRVALVGPRVSNAGAISTPDGQTILAAGLEVGFVAHDGGDATLRGLDVFVGKVGAAGEVVTTDDTFADIGTATNAAGGLIDAPRASVFITGKAVNQDGVINSSTSVSRNGRVDLLASYDAVGSGGFVGLPSFLYKSTGSVSFGAGSLTQIVPEWASTERVVGTSLALGSQANVTGLTVYFGADSTLFAPSAEVKVNAGRWGFNRLGTSIIDPFVNTEGQIYVDENALLDVGGSTDVAASVAENYISVQLRGAELANSPLQKDGALRGQTIVVDTRVTGAYNGASWVGTPLADTSGYVALMDRTVGQLTTGGGAVRFNAGGSVVLQSGSAINVSGGWINYAAATVETSKVVTGGQVLDISQATPDRVYSGLYKGVGTPAASKWGAPTENYVNTLEAGSTYEEGYVQGGKGGSLSITAPAMALDGRLSGLTVAGPRQRAAIPAPAALSLVFQAQFQDPDNALNFFTDSRTPPSLRFEQGVTLAPAAAFMLDESGRPPALRAGRRDEVVLSPALFTEDGFGNVTIGNGEGEVRVAAGSPLSLAPKGRLSITAANLYIEDDITAPGGSLDFTVANISIGTRNALLSNTNESASPAAGRGQFKLGDGVTLSTAALVVNDRADSSSAGIRPLVTAGGSISVVAYDASFGAGSVLDVSGGVVAGGAGKYTYGAGGSLAILAGQDVNVSSVLGGRLDFDPARTTLVGFSGGKGASLTLQAPLVQIGGSSEAADTLVLSPDFFSEGGFAGFTVRGLGTPSAGGDVFAPALNITPGTVVAPLVKSWLAATDAAAVDGIALAPYLQADGLRVAANLSFVAAGVRDTFNISNPLLARGDLVVGAGASIVTEPKGVVSLKGDTVKLDGLVSAPGGTISVSGGGDSNRLFPFTGNNLAVDTVVLGSSSVLSVAGVTVLVPDTTGLGYRTGSVLAGGTIKVSGNIDARSGAFLDVSGVSGVLDLDPAYTFSGGAATNVGRAGDRIATQVDGNAGSISFNGGQQLRLDATLRGAAGGVFGLGGSLSVSSGIYQTLNNATLLTPFDVTLDVVQSGVSAAIGRGSIVADRLNEGGFDNITLAGTTRFDGDVELSALRTLAVGGNGVIYADGVAHLSAPAVKLGTDLDTPHLVGEVLGAFSVGGSPYFAPPTHGAGSLVVEADKLIDVGNLSLQGIGGVVLDVFSGDLRGSGTFDLAGDLLIAAGQIYPTTASTFTIAASGYQDGADVPGSITIYKGEDRALPLSAGGTLNLYAGTILQDGTLRAPIGTINLGWNGVGSAPVDAITGAAVPVAVDVTLGAESRTSVSAEGQTIPYGLVLNGGTWIDPSGKDITVAGVPAKTINIAGASVVTEAGSVVDTSGGGDLYAYRWVSGTGGTVDVLSSAGSFAVIPAYGAGYAPYAPYNTSTLAKAGFGSDTGYTNPGIAVGDQVYLSGGGGLAAGAYTLLPARYALLPGAFLVTPKTGVPVAAASVQNDGSAIVAGYRYNSLVEAPEDFSPLRASFEIASAKVVKVRAEYENSLANTFLPASAATNNVAVSRLPRDAGQLALSATQAMSLKGAINAATSGGRGGLIDINSPVDIVISGAGAAGEPGRLVLDAAELSAYTGASLLIGGSRHNTAAGTSVAVSTNNLTVDNAGTPLAGADLILVSRQNLTIAEDAEIEQRGSLGGASDDLFIGDASVAGSGNGALVRIGGGAVRLSRSGVDAGQVSGVSLSVGAGAVIRGGSGLTFDSTGVTTLDEAASFGGQNLTIDSGRISLQLASPGELQPDAGLVLTDAILASLQQSAGTLSLLSYSSIDIYGAGQVGSASVGGFALHAPVFRGFNTGGGTAVFVAKNILLDAGSGGGDASADTASAGSGTLAFHASQTLRLGEGRVRVGQFADLVLSGAQGIISTGTGGISTAGNLTLEAPVLTGEKSAKARLDAGGALRFVSPASAGSASVTGGLGASLALTGASVVVDGNIALPSGDLKLRSLTGDVVIGGEGTLDVGGTAQTFFEVTKFTNGGTISLSADTGSITVASGGVLKVAASSAGGDAGSISVAAVSGAFTLDGALSGHGGAKGEAGSFSLDVASLPEAGFAALNTALDTAGFNASRSFRVRAGDVVLSGLASAKTFRLSADQGSILVTGRIDASGDTGGRIELAASGDVALADGASLDVSAANFNHAGKGGAVFLSAGAETNGGAATGAFVDVRTGSSIDLTVDARTDASAAQGKFAGTLVLRAPQSAAGDDLQIKPLAGAVLGGSSVVVEGYALTDLTASGGLITAEVQSAVLDNVTEFGAHSAAIAERLLSVRPELASLLHVRAGAEIINRDGDLTLDRIWDFSSYRSGAALEPGALTLRAAGDLVFGYDEAAGVFGSLSDGFSAASEGQAGLWHAGLLAPGTQSWSYRLVAGADFGSVDLGRVLTADAADAHAGSVLLGEGSPELPNPFGGQNVDLAANIIPGFYQVIRTGTGDISIVARGDVRFLNPLATVYTAGTQAESIANFDVPRTGYFATSSLGALQQANPYAAQYSLGGGDVSIAANHDIIRSFEVQGELLDDASAELPTNWLYRRGAVDPVTGQFATVRTAGNKTEVASTSWWVDFSNFFQDVATFGGGDVTLAAGRDVKNVSASVPTNARMPKGTPSADSLVELGGGDLSVRAGRNVDGGVYYVERGSGLIDAGASVATNSTRSTLSLADKATLGLAAPDPSTWLPTTLFVGKGGFTVSAHDDLLLGQVANAFLLPQGINNSYFQKSYFSTYAPDTFVNVSALTGDVSLKAESNGDAGSLLNWYQNVLVYDNTFARTLSTFSQPWLRLAESSAEPLSVNISLLPGRLMATTFTGDLNLLGNLQLAPAASGTVELIARGSVNALQRIGLQLSSRAYDAEINPYVWSTSKINLSDADPAAIPGITSPLGYGVAGTRDTSVTLFDNSLNPLFNESGSTEGIFGVIQTKQALHTSGLLHAADDAPAYIYALEGDISGLTLFSSKFARVSAGRDITDIALYLQNNRADDLSVVTAGRDLTAYNTNSALRTRAVAAGNALLLSSPSLASPASGDPTAGDIQIGGSGALQVKAGRNLDLGSTPGSADPQDGTAVGITSIGNSRNPYLPSTGASITVGAGLGGAQVANYAAFNQRFLDPSFLDGYAGRYLPVLAGLMGLSNATATQIWNAFQALPAERRDSLSLSLFYSVLRDAGRDHGDPDAAGFGAYALGDAAIAALFPGSKDWSGELALSSREIRTTNGGDIRVLAPGGALTLGFDIPKRASAPPGIVTERGGAVSIFTRDDVNIGVLRIFTLRGGDIVIWSTLGDIAAGFSSKTIQSAAPTRVLIDPQSGDVKTDLAGLATGGGIGVLATVAGVRPGDVDLIAPTGTIDAGDAGIRSSGNLNISALVVLNAANIQAGGTTTGAPAVSAPSLGGLAVASNTTNNAGNSAADPARQDRGPVAQTAMPSLISVEVLGYGGGDASDSDSGQSEQGGDKDKPDEKKPKPKDDTDQTPADAVPQLSGGATPPTFSAPPA